MGFSEDEHPVLIHLEGRYDGSEFWNQQEALTELHDQMLAELVGDQPQLGEQPLPERPAAPPAVKSSFWGRRLSKMPEVKPAMKAKAPVTVDVQMEQVHFRSENEYGLYETLRSRAVVMVVDVR